MLQCCLLISMCFTNIFFDVCLASYLPFMVQIQWQFLWQIRKLLLRWLISAIILSLNGWLKAKIFATNFEFIKKRFFFIIIPVRGHSNSADARRILDPPSLDQCTKKYKCMKRWSLIRDSESSNSVNEIQTFVFKFMWITSKQRPFAMVQILIWKKVNNLLCSSRFR